MLFKCSIPLDHHAIKKNSRQIFRGTHGQPFIGKSNQLTVAEKILVQRLTIARLQNRLIEPIAQDVQVTFRFYFKNYYIKPKRKTDAPRRSQKLGDLSNLYQLPEDCLVQAGVLLDDAQIQSHDGSRILPGSENRLDIEIKAMAE